MPPGTGRKHQADWDWVERAIQLDLYCDSSHVETVASRLPERAALLRNSSFLIDTTTPHGDVLINENTAIKPTTGWVTIHASDPISSGVHEWQIKVINQGETSDGSGLMLGVVPKAFTRYDSFISQGGGWCISRAGKFYGNWKKVEGLGTSTPFIFGTGDTVVFELDMETSRMTVSVGEKVIVGEISNLAPEVFPAVSLHYRQQHVSFESRRTKQRQQKEKGWFLRSRLHLPSPDVLFSLTPDHLASRVSQLLQHQQQLNYLDGTIGRPSPRTQGWGSMYPSQWQAYFSLREEIVFEVFTAVGKMLFVPEKSVKHESPEPPPPVVRSVASVQDVAMSCGMELSLALLAAVSVDNQDTVVHVFTSLANQLQQLPLLSLASNSLVSRESFDGLRDFAVKVVTSHKGDVQSGSTPPVVTVALRLLVTLALLRGEATEVLRVVQLLLSSPCSTATLPVLDLLDRLDYHHGVQYDLPLLAVGEDTEQLELRSAQKGRGRGRMSIGDRITITSMGCDRDHLYLSTVEEGLVKMGHGKGCVPPLEVVAKNEKWKGGTIAVIGEKIFLRPSNATRINDLVVLCREFQEVGSAVVDCTGSVTSDVPLSAAAFHSEGNGSPASAHPRLESKVITDGRLLYLIAGREHLLRRDEQGSLSAVPTNQCRPQNNPVTVAVYDPDQEMKHLRTITLTGPIPGELQSVAGAGGRSVLHFTKDTVVSMGTLPENLCSPTGHISVELWLNPSGADATAQPANPEDAVRVCTVYSHGEPSSNGEVFIDLHFMEGGGHGDKSLQLSCIKGGGRIEVRNGVRTSAAVATVPLELREGWIHVAVVFDGRWKIYLNGVCSGVSKHEESGTMVIDRPKGRWSLGGGFLGSIAEVRVWRCPRVPSVILRDLQRQLSGTEAGLLYYWPLNEGAGHVAYDWGQGARHSGWITQAHGGVPMWKKAVDFPVLDSDPTAHPHHVSPWPVFLPSVLSAAMYTNGHQLAVLVPGIEDAGGGKRQGSLTLYSLDDGRQLPAVTLAPPSVDSAVQYDHCYNGIWHGSVTFQVLCWTPCQCPRPPPLRVKRASIRLGEEVRDVAAPEVAMRLLASMEERAMRHTFGEWPGAARPLAIDEGKSDLFELLLSILQSQFKIISSGRKTVVMGSSDAPLRITVACLQLLRVNCLAASESTLDASKGGVGGQLYSTLLTLFDLPDPPPPLIDAATAALRDGLTVFYPSISDRLDLLRSLLSDEARPSTGSAKYALLSVLAECMTIQASCSVVVAFNDNLDKLRSLLKLLIDSSEQELQAGILSPQKIRSESPAGAILRSLQVALLGGSTSRPEMELGPFVLEYLAMNVEFLKKVCQLLTTHKEKLHDGVLPLLHASPIGGSLGQLISSLHFALPISEDGKRLTTCLDLLCSISGSLEAIAGHFPEVQAMEEAYNSQQLVRAAVVCQGEGSTPLFADQVWAMFRDDDKEKEIHPNWLHALRLITDYVAAVTAGRMVASYGEGENYEARKWVDSPLLAGGFRDKSARPRLCDQIAEGVGQGMAVWQAVKRAANAGSNSNTLVDTAMRLIFAILIRDSPHDTAVASLETQQMSGVHSPSVLNKFRKVAALKGWLLHLRHETPGAPQPSSQRAGDVMSPTRNSTFGLAPPLANELDADDPPPSSTSLSPVSSTSPSPSSARNQPSSSTLHQLIRRAEFLLRFHASPDPSDNRVVLRALIASSGGGRRSHRINSLRGGGNPSSWRSMFHGWRAIKKLQKLLALNLPVEDGTGSVDLLLEFLTSPQVDLDAIQDQVDARTARGKFRAEGLEYLGKLLATPSRQIRIEAIRILAESVATHHYTDGILAAGPAAATAVQEGMYAILRSLLQQITKDDLLDGGDEYALVQCYLVLRLLHCRWHPMDFAFLRAVDLARSLFQLFSCWKGVELSTSSLLSLEQVNGDKDQIDPYQLFKIRLRQTAADLFCGCALRSAMALTTVQSHPGLLRANTNFTIQVIECLVHELKLSIKALGKGLVLHVLHLLAITASLLQALCPSSGSDLPPTTMLEGLGVGELVPILIQCVALQPQGAEGSEMRDLEAKIPEYAMSNMCRLLPHLSVELVEQGVGVLAPKAPKLANIPEQPPTTPLRNGRGSASGGRVASIDEGAGGPSGVSGLNTIRLLIAVAGGVFPPSSTPYHPVAFMAVSLLRQLYLRPFRTWQPAVVAWLQAALSTVPENSCLSLGDDSMWPFVVALKVLTGTPQSPRPGITAEHCPRNSSVRNLVAIINCDLQNGKATVVGADLGLASEDRVVDLDNVIVPPQPLQNKVDSTLFPLFLSVLKRILSWIHDDSTDTSSGCSSTDSEGRLPSGFPRGSRQCLVHALLLYKLLRGLSLFLTQPECSDTLVSHAPAVLPQLASLARQKVLDPLSLEALEAKSLYLHELMAEVQSDEVECTLDDDTQRHMCHEQEAGDGEAELSEEEAQIRAARRAAAEDLSRVLPGLSVELCQKALELTKDDKDKAAAVLMDSADDIAVAVEVEAAEAAKRRHVSEKRKARARQAQRRARKDDVLQLDTPPYALSFGPAGTGCVVFEGSVPRDFVIELLVRVKDDGPFGLPLPRADLDPSDIIPYPVLQGVHGTEPFVSFEALGCGALQVLVMGKPGGVVLRGEGPDGWHHLVVVYQGSTVEVHHRGKVVAHTEGIEPDVEEGAKGLWVIGPGREHKERAHLLREMTPEHSALSLLYPCMVVDIATVRIWEARGWTVADTNSLISPLVGDNDVLELIEPPCDPSVLPHREDLVLAVAMREGTGPDVLPDVGELGKLEGGVRWSTVSLPSMAPEDNLSNVDDALLQGGGPGGPGGEGEGTGGDDVEKPDVAMHSNTSLPLPPVEETARATSIPRTEWYTAYSRLPKNNPKRLMKECCITDISLCILYAREALLNLLDVLCKPGRDAPMPPLVPHPALMPSTLAALPRLTSTALDPASVETLRAATRRWLSGDPSVEDVGRFTKGCLAILEEAPDTYLFETPSHPYNPLDVTMQTVDIPGATSYSITFDSRCRTLDYLYFFTDSTQKVQLAKFPDSQGQWTPLELDHHSFFFKFSADSGSPSWGYSFIVAVRTQRLNVAVELLLELLQAIRGNFPKYAPAVLCNAVVSHLVAAWHRETSLRRRMVGSVLTFILSRVPHLFRTHDKPRLDSLFFPIQKNVDAHFTREKAVPPGPTGAPRCHSKYFQAMMELLVSVEIAKEAWGKEGAGERWDVGKKQQRYVTKMAYALGTVSLHHEGEGNGGINHTLSCHPMVLHSSREASSGVNIHNGGGSRWIATAESGSWHTLCGWTGFKKGRWYYEVRLFNSGIASIGWCTQKFLKAPNPNGECTESWGVCGHRGVKSHAGERVEYPASAPLKWKARDTVGVMIDCGMSCKRHEHHRDGSASISYTINGFPLGVAFDNLPGGGTEVYFPCISFVGGLRDGCRAVDINFGATPFAYPPPPGFLPVDGRHMASPSSTPPIHHLLAFTKVANALCNSQPLPAPMRTLGTEHYPDKSVREGPDVVEVVALDGRPRISDLSNPALIVVKSHASACTVRGGARVTCKGRWYYEVTLGSDGLMQIGWITDSYIPDPVRAKGVGDDPHSWSFDGCRLILRHSQEQVQLTGRRGWREGDIVGCLLNLDVGTIDFTLNGEPLVRDPSSDSPAAFRSLQVYERYYPAISMDPDNCIEINFGGAPFAHPPYSSQGVGAPSAVHEMLEAMVDDEGETGEDIPSEWPYSSTLDRDAAVVALANHLCDLRRRTSHTLPFLEHLTPFTLTDYGLQSFHPKDLNTRFILLRHFNSLFRLMYPYLNLTHAVGPCFTFTSAATTVPSPPMANGYYGPVAEAAMRCKGLFLCTATSTILTHHVHATNALVEPAPVKVVLNRRRAIAHRADPSKCPDGTISLFGQIHSLLADRHPSMFFTGRRFWSVSFQGEGAEDVGGPYRECLSDICNELMSSAVPLFIPSPNAKNNIGSHRDRWVPNPKCTSSLHLSMYAFVGKLMAACLRASEPLPLYLVPLVWKRLAGDPVGSMELHSIDRSTANSLHYFLKLDDEGVTPAMFKEVYEGSFTTVLSSGEEVELIPGGASIPVTFENRIKYVWLVVERRLHEADRQIEAIADGFYSVLPAHITHLLTASSLEALVCGRDEWDIADLKALARYELLSPEDRRVGFFWSVLDEMSRADKSLFLRFVSGRERVPIRIKLMPLATRDDPDKYLPVASTCFFWISLPDYSSLEVMREKLLYAIRNCIDIDADYRVRGSVDEEASPALGYGEPPDEEDFEDYSHLL